MLFAYARYGTNKAGKKPDKLWGTATHARESYAWLKNMQSSQQLAENRLFFVK
jgi:hypothetical protein